MLKFNNINVPAFVKVNSINNPILPPVSQNTVKVSGRAGNISFGNELDSREIEVTISIIADSPSDLRIKIRQLAEWLYYDEPKQLIILDEPELYYLAQVTGSTNIDEILHVGQGTITFVCNDPYAYAVDEKVYAVNPTAIDDPVNIINTGQVKAYPRLEFTFKQPTTNFNIITGDEVMTFGSANVDLTPIDVNPLVWFDPMDSSAGWTSANYIDDGVIVGNSFISNGYSVQATDFGQGTRWHGQAGVKSIGTQLQDFAVRSLVGLKPTAVGQIGRIQVYGLDINGNIIFCISIRQGDPFRIRPYAQVRIGNKYYIESYGDYDGAWNDFTDGRMDIARRGDEWSIYYAIRKTDGTNRAGFHRKFNITENGYNKNKLAQIQIHIGAFGDEQEYPVVPNMYIADLKVWNEGFTTSAGQIPVIFKEDDVLIIDSATDSIWLNGVPYYKSLNPSSQFPVLEKGANGITVSPLVTKDGIIKFRERFW